VQFELCQTQNLDYVIIMHDNVYIACDSGSPQSSGTKCARQNLQNGAIIGESTVERRTRIFIYCRIQGYTKLDTRGYMLLKPWQ